MAEMSIRDVSLNVEVMGQGYPLALMHGGPGQDYSSLLPLKPLEDQFTLVYYDHRCNGRSMGMDITSMTMDNLTADAEALREKLGFGKWAVLGHSFGGQVALEYALRYPQNLSHLILMNTGGDQWWVDHNSAELLAKRGYNSNAVEAAHRFFNGQFTPDEFLSLFIKFSRAYYYHFDLLGMLGGMISSPTPKLRPEATIFGYSQVLPGWTVMDRLGEIKVPTLVVAGRADFLFPTEHQVALANGIPNACLEIIECAGHNPHMEQQEVTIKVIRDFLGANHPVAQTGM